MGCVSWVFGALALGFAWRAFFLWQKMESYGKRFHVNVQ
jgi:hypothetical protein